MLTSYCSFTSCVEALRDDPSRSDGHEYCWWAADLWDDNFFHHVLPGGRGVLTIIELGRGCLVFGAAAGGALYGIFVWNQLCLSDMMQSSFFMLCSSDICRA